MLFDQLFRPDTAETLNPREAEFLRRASVLDSLRQQAKKLSGSLGVEDRHKLDEYLTSIRDLERRMQNEKEWLRQPKPQVEALQFGKLEGLDPEKAGSCLTPSPLPCKPTARASSPTWPAWTAWTRTGTWKEMGNPYNYHEMTHHGEDPDKLRWFTKADTYFMEEWAYFLNKLKAVKEGDGTLLDHTLVAYGSSGGSINAHHNHHLPTMIAGGSRLGVKHQGHIIKEDMRLGNLWRTMFEPMGVPMPANFQGGESDGIVKEIV